MICGNCGQKAWRTFSGSGYEFCNNCESKPLTSNNLEPDVYFKPGVPEENLPDDPRTGKAPVFYSKREMADYLKKHKLVQIRDKHHGAYSVPESSTGNKGVDRTSKSWHESRMQIKHIREMGIDVRRQAYLKAAKGL